MGSTPEAVSLGRSPRAGLQEARRRLRLKPQPARSVVLVGEGLLVGASSVLCAAWALQLWHANLSIPLRYTPVDDTKFYLMLGKGIIDHGSYLANSNLGAPFGQKLYEYPQGGDGLNLLIVRMLGLFSSNPALVINLFFLGTFALTGFTAHVALRCLGVSRAPSAVAAVLFSLLSYHFFRGESHLVLSAYYSVPLAAFLFLQLVGARTLFEERGGSGPRARRWLSARNLWTVALCIVIGSDNLYYATFAVVILLSGVLLVAFMQRWRACVQGLAVVAMITVTLTANLAPSLVYRAQHGGDAAVERSASFTETSDEAFSLRLGDLLLPAPTSRIPPLSRAAQRYDHVIAPGYCEACYASLGSVGTIGFLWLVVSAGAMIVGAAGWFASHRLARGASVGVLAALAIGTVGGLASLIEVFVTPDIRAWNRISVFIAFFSLLAVALLLERLAARLRPVRMGPALAGAACAGVLAFGVFDQTGASFTPTYAATARQWRSDGTFVAEIERRLPRGASVFQLPYVPFPEGYPETPVGDRVATYSTKYELLRGYLHSHVLRWSYGTMKGTPSDWSAQLAGQPLGYVVAAAAAAGFDGLWVDPAGFEPPKAARLLATLEAVLASRPLVSPMGDLWFFDLRPYLRRLETLASPARLALLARETLHPFTVRCNRDGLLLGNPGPSARPVTVTAHLLRAGLSYETSRLDVPDGQASDFPAAAVVTVRRRLELAPGRSELSLAAGLPSDASTRVLYATVTDDALVGFAGTAAKQELVPGLTGPPCGESGA